MRAGTNAVLAAWLTTCSVANLGWCQTPIFSDDFDGGTIPTFEVTPVAGSPIPQDDMPWGVNTSGLPATWESNNNPFPSGTFYAYINDNDPGNGNGTRFITTDDDSDPNGYGAQITGQVTTFSFDFFEPTDQAGDDTGGGTGFGYSNADDLNSGERVFRAFLDDGMLRADNGLAGASVAYALDTVHTVWMFANDSTSSVANYSGGETLDPGEADVWISLAGADPIYAFTAGMQNAAPHGVGFRSFTGDVEEAYIDNVLVMPGATFQRDAFNPPPRLTLLVDRDNGQVRIENNTEESMATSSYRIVSDGGASLEEASWNPIANQSIPGFPPGDGTGNGWEIGLNSDNGELREYFLQGESTLDPGDFVSLGAAYNTGVDAADLRFEYVASGDTLVSGPITYGTISVGGVAGDYNWDGTVNAADYTAWRNHLGQTYQLTNEDPSNMDGQVTSADYSFWKAHFGETAAGSGALARGAVPEPATIWLLLTTAIAICQRRSAICGP